MDPDDPSSIHWTGKQVFKLIDMFQERPCLWDYKLHEYRDRRKKHEAWTAIANEFNTDRAHVEKKMRCLLGQFQRELRKPKIPGCEHEEQSKWFAFKKLLFMKGRSRSSNSSGVIKPGQIDDQEPSSEEEMNEKEMFVTPPLFTLKRHKPAEPPVVESPAFEEVPTSSISFMQDRLARDEYDVFGEHVAMKVRKIADSYARSTAQFHINNILYKAEIGDFNMKRDHSIDNY